MTEQELSSIPENYYRGDDNPAAYTVGDLKKILEKVPDSLEIQQGFNDGCEVKVFNFGSPTMHLTFDEIEECDDCGYASCICGEEE